MKLSKDAVNQREEFVRQAVRTEPSITGNQLQALLKQHFGKQMRLMRLYAIKNQTLTTLKEKS